MQNANGETETVPADTAMAAQIDELTAVSAHMLSYHGPECILAENFMTHCTSPPVLLVHALIRCYWHFRLC